MRLELNRERGAVRLVWRDGEPRIWLERAREAPDLVQMRVGYDENGDALCIEYDTLEALRWHLWRSGGRLDLATVLEQYPRDEALARWLRENPDPEELPF